MIIFGGEGSTLLNDVWALGLDCSQPTWTNLTPPSGPAPSAREYASAVFDAPRNRMVVYGGETSTGHFSPEVWAFSLSTMLWTQLPDAPACYRAGHTAVVGNGLNMIVFAGNDGGSTERHDAWSMSLQYGDWSKVFPSDPTSCQFDCPFDHQEPCTGYEFGQTSPTLIQYHASVWDSPRARMLVHGGWYDFTEEAYAEVYALNGSSFSRLSPSGDGPGVIYGQTLVYDSARDRMIVFGGNSGSGILGGLYRLDFANHPADSPAWSTLSVAAGPSPSARYHHAAIYDPVTDRMILFGGDGTTGKLGDTWALDLNSTDTTPPAAIMSLDTKKAGSGYVTLWWNAPADDGAAGCRATSYVVRYATAPITSEAQFAAATNWANVPQPSAPGLQDTVKITGLTNGVWYYFSVKTADEVPNLSGLSNSPCAKPGVPAGYCDDPGANAPAEPARLLELAPVRSSSRGGFLVSFTLPRESEVTLELLDVAGRRVRSQRLETLAAGSHDVEFAAGQLAPGYYIVRLRTLEAAMSRPAIVTR
jgi:hypothetical protein